MLINSFTNSLTYGCYKSQTLLYFGGYLKTWEDFFKPPLICRGQVVGSAILALKDTKAFINTLENVRMAFFHFTSLACALEPYYWSTKTGLKINFSTEEFLPLYYRDQMPDLITQCKGRNSFGG